ncbi:MAG: hypothetical protein IPF46_16120 [Saprospiraceae bacterium]|nr:hypothetical protein [Candidatus Vicinibacter affinis]
MSCLLDLLKLIIETLRSCGLSNQKAQYIRNIAEHFNTNQLKDEMFHDLSDGANHSIFNSHQRWCRWTVEMVLIFWLVVKDVFTLDDYGIQTALVEIYRLKEEKKVLN